VLADDAVVQALARMVRDPGARRRVRRGLERMLAEESMIGEVLDGFGIPRELAALALVESGFDRSARAAEAGAAGFWQLTPATARRYGLVVGEGRDDRADARRETEAAAALLADLHRAFGDWDLTVAAYNQGPAAVTRAIAEGGTRDLAELQRRGLLTPYRAEVMATVLITRDPRLVD
jgi:membrane-bound lytic murein transglycosylase D